MIRKIIESLIPPVVGFILPLGLIVGVLWYFADTPEESKTYWEVNTPRYEVILTSGERIEYQTFSMKKGWGGELRVDGVWYGAGAWKSVKRRN